MQEEKRRPIGVLPDGRLLYERVPDNLSSRVALALGWEHVGDFDPKVCNWGVNTWRRPNGTLSGPPQFEWSHDEAFAALRAILPLVDHGGGYRIQIFWDGHFRHWRCELATDPHLDWKSHKVGEGANAATAICRAILAAKELVHDPS